MKTLTKMLFLFIALPALLSCSKDDGNPVANNITLHFDNTFKNTTIARFFLLLLFFYFFHQYTQPIALELGTVFIYAFRQIRR